MGLIKTYQRYGLVSQFSVIGSSKCNTVLLKKDSGPKSSSDHVSYFAATAAVENVVLWDIRKAEQVFF